MDRGFVIYQLLQGPIAESMDLNTDDAHRFGNKVGDTRFEFDALPYGSTLWRDSRWLRQLAGD